MGDSDKSHDNVKVKDFRSSPLIHKYSYGITKRNCLVLTWFIHEQSLLAIPCHLLHPLPPELCSNRTCSIIFPYTKLSLTSLYFLRPFRFFFFWRWVQNLSLSSLQDLPWSPQPFRGAREQPYKDTIQLLQHPWVQLLGSVHLWLNWSWQHCAVLCGEMSCAVMPLSRADKRRCTTSAVQLSAADSRAVFVTVIWILLFCTTWMVWMHSPGFSFTIQGAASLWKKSPMSFCSAVVLLVGLNCGAWWHLLQSWDRTDSFRVQIIVKFFIILMVFRVSWIQIIDNGITLISSLMLFAIGAQHCMKQITQSYQIFLLFCDWK